MMEKIKSFMKNDRLYWLVSALFSMLLMLLVMSYSGILGNGKYAFIADDLYEQVADFSRLFYSKLFEGSNIYYSFDAGLGMNTSLLFAFYSMSPFNILYYLLGAEGINAASIIIFVIKIGLSATFFQLYCRYNLNSKGAISIFAAICYALMAYAVYISRMNPLYDAVYLLPLFFILIKYSIKNRTFYFLTVAYVYVFLTNFYGGYIVGLSSFIYFIYYIFSANEKIINKAKFGIRYAVSVLVAILCSGFLIAPALYEALNQKVIENADSFSSISILDQIAYLFPFHSASMYQNYPQYYCGLPVLLLIPAFFFNKCIDKKKKCVAAMVLVLSSLSMLIKPMYLAAHMFNDPTGYTCRYAYVIAFFMISIFIKTIHNISGIEYRKVIAFDACLVMAYVISCVLKLINGEAQDLTVFVGESLAVIFAIAWIVLSIISRRILAKESLVKNIWIIAGCLLAVELGANNYYMLKSIAYPGLDEMNTYISNSKNVISDLKGYDDGDYRVQYNASNNCNQGALLGYHGSTLFASSSNNELKDFLGNIGVFCNEFMITDCGNTDLARLLLNEKYIANGRITINDNVERGIILNENVAGMGFMVSSGIVNYKSEGNVFDNQDKIYRYLGRGETPITLFEGGVDIEPHNVYVQSSEDGIVLTRASLDEDGYVAIRIPYIEGKKAYTWMYTGYNRASFESPLLITNDVENEYSYMDSYLTTSHIVKMAKEEDDFCVYIYFGIDSVEEITIYDLSLAYFDEGLTSSIVSGINESFSLRQFEDGYISGTVTSSEDGILFMAVPYEEGWEAYVDGVLVEVIPLLDNAFVGIPVRTGEHEIELKFTAPYSTAGKRMSIVGIVLLIAMIVMEYAMSKKYKEKNGE